MEIQHQPKRHVEEFHVTEKLCFVNRQHVLDGLQLNQKAAVDEYVELQDLLEHLSFVIDRDVFLMDCRNAPQLELSEQAFFVNALQQSGPEDAMHLDGRADGHLAQCVGFLGNADA